MVGSTVCSYFFVVVDEKKGKEKKGKERKGKQKNEKKFFVSFFPLFFLLFFLAEEKRKEIHVWKKIKK